MPHTAAGTAIEGLLQNTYKVVDSSPKMYTKRQTLYIKDKSKRPHLTSGVQDISPVEVTDNLPSHK